MVLVPAGTVATFSGLRQGRKSPRPGFWLADITPTRSLSNRGCSALLAPAKPSSASFMGSGLPDLQDEVGFEHATPGRRGAHGDLVVLAAGTGCEPHLHAARRGRHGPHRE